MAPFVGDSWHHPVQRNPRVEMARRRFVAVLPGLVAFVVLGALADNEFWAEWWFYVGLVTAVAVVFVEPFFSRPQDALVNALGGIAAFWSADRETVEALWSGYLALQLVVLVASATAALTPAGSTSPIKILCHRLSRSLGRAAVVGPLALSLEVLRRSASGERDFEYLAFGTAALLAGLTIDWTVLLRAVLSSVETEAIAVVATGPRRLLLSSSSSLMVGARVNVTASRGRCAATIVNRLPHADGQRLELALGSDWHALVGEFPESVAIEVESEPSGDPVVGVAGQGTTDQVLCFEPLRSLPVGTSVTVGEWIYQVAAVELSPTTWPGSITLARRATARLVGTLVDGTIRMRPRLPLPHDEVRLPESLKSTIPPTHFIVGSLRGTQVEIGMHRSASQRGHTAILGMSGTGKTAVAQRLAQEMGNDSAVVVLDITGEYKGQLGFADWNSDVTTVGHRVHEPTGEPTKKAQELIEACMTEGSAEYADPSRTCQPRVVLLEEAHSFIPEWNFASRGQQDHVNFTTRMIMQARKYGLSVVVVSQRTAVVSKSALSQCENYICLRTIDETSLSYMEAVVGAEMREAIASLAKFEAVCVGPGFNTDGPVIVSLRSP